MTPIEQLAKEFSKGNPATEAALIAMGRKVREQDIEILRADHIVLKSQQYYKASGIHRAIILLEELL